MRRLSALWSACERVLAADRFPRHLWRACLCLLLAVAGLAACERLVLQSVSAATAVPA